MVRAVKDTLIPHSTEESRGGVALPGLVAAEIPPRQSGWSLHLHIPPLRNAHGGKVGRLVLRHLGGNHSSISGSPGTQRKACHPCSPTAALPGHSPAGTQMPCLRGRLLKENPRPQPRPWPVLGYLRARLGPLTHCPTPADCHPHCGSAPGSLLGRESFSRSPRC